MGALERRLSRRNPEPGGFEEGSRRMKIYNTLTRGKEELVPLVARRDQDVLVRRDRVRPLPRRPRAERDGLRRDHALPALRGLSRDVRAELHRHRRQDHPTRQPARACRRARSRSATSPRTAQDMAALGVLPPDVEPKATEHIPEMIALIERLVAARLRLRGGRRRLLRGARGSPPTASCRARTSTSCWPARASKSTSASAIRATSRCGRAPSRASRRGRARGARPSGLAHRVLGDGDAATWARPSTSTAAART